MSAARDDYVKALENLTPATLPALMDRFAETAEFRDPFNHARGRAAIETVFTHMFAAIDGVSFKVGGQAGQGEQVFLTWRFSGTNRRLGPIAFEGASAITFRGDGKVIRHIDYWDTAALTCRIPLFGAILRRLRRGMAAVPPA